MMRRAVTVMAVVMMAGLGACGDDPATPADAAIPAIDADPTIDAAPPRETIMATQSLAAGDLVEGIMGGGSAERAVIRLEAATATIDWNLHGHNGGRTQMLYEELGKMIVEYTFVPPSNGEWYLLIRNGGSTNADIQVSVDLYGEMTWRWQ